MPLPKWLLKWPIALHKLLYRLTDGRWADKDNVLLLTTTGRKSGRQRTTPVLYLREGDNYIIAGTNAGRDNHPAWVWNLRSQPQATIQVGGATKTVIASQADSTEREQLWSRLTNKTASFRDYEKRTEREIPVFVLRPLA